MVDDGGTTDTKLSVELVKAIIIIAIHLRKVETGDQGGAEALLDTLAPTLRIGILRQYKEKKAAQRNEL
jgi:hypothetical protein